MIKIRNLCISIALLFLGLNSFAFRLGLASNEKQVFLNFESWKTSPVLNVEKMILAVQKIDPDPYAKKFQKVFMFVRKNELTLSYSQVFLQCRTEPATAEKTPVLLMSQYGAMDFATINNQFKYTLGMSTPVVLNLWAQLKTFAQITSESNPCSEEFEKEYQAYLAENIKQTPIREENFVISADEKYFYLKLDKFFEVRKKVPPTVELSLPAAQPETSPVVDAQPAQNTDVE